MTTITSKPNLCKYNELNVKARMKAFWHVKEIHLDELREEFIDEMRDVVVGDLRLYIEDYYFGGDSACTASLCISYPDKMMVRNLKGARAYAFIQNHMFDIYHKCWKRHVNISMVQEKYWMNVSEYNVLRNAWGKFKTTLRSGGNPSVQDFIYMLRDEYIQEWVTRSKSYTDDEAVREAEAKGYKFDEINGDLYFYDPVA